MKKDGIVLLSGTNCVWCRDGPPDTNISLSERRQSS